MENTDFELIRTYCLSLPGTEEDIKWGTNLCMLVAEKMFCVIELEAPHEITFKVPDNQFDEMLAMNDISPAPYLARAKWVMAANPNVFDRKTWEHYLLQSYQLIRSKLPAKIRNAMDEVREDNAG